MSKKKIHPILTTTILEGIITAQAHLMEVSINTKTFCVSLSVLI